MKPELVEKKILKKLLKKSKGGNKYFNKNLSLFKKTLFNNWYILLILGIIFFLLIIKFKDTYDKKINEKLSNIKEPKKEKNTYETLANSESYEKDYYSMIQKVRPVGANHPSFNY
jgi:hypothetical protein